MRNFLSTSVVPANCFVHSSTWTNYREDVCVWKTEKWCLSPRKVSRLIYVSQNHRKTGGTNKISYTSRIISMRREEKALGVQWNNGSRREEPVLWSWAGCPSFLRGTHWVYSACNKTMAHNRSSKKSPISRDGKIQLTFVCLAEQWVISWFPATTENELGTGFYFTSKQMSTEMKWQQTVSAPRTW